jgi:hypothetical protein
VNRKELAAKVCHQVMENNKAWERASTDSEVFSMMLQACEALVKVLEGNLPKHEADDVCGTPI